MSAYADALQKAITPGCTVFDIGAGPGVFSLLACKYGAGKVVAIEPDDSVALLQTLAKANGCSNRIEVFQGLSTDYRPETRADVIVSDLRGTLPLFEAHLAVIQDARERLLAPGGSLIPARDVVKAALAQNAKAYAEICEEPWLRNRFGLDLSAGLRHVVNLHARIDQEDTELLGKPVELWTLDYQRITESDFSAKIELVAEREGMAHGLLLWFDSELAQGIGYSNAPDQPRQVYAQVFMPFERPFRLKSGDRVEVDITARQIDGNYVWAWTSSFWPQDAKHPEQHFRQSTFLGKVMSPKSLRVRASNFVPLPTVEQDIDRSALALVDGQRSQGEIADLLREQFPDRFENAVEALNHVTRLTDRYR